jgi:serine/threonine-protein kinase RsbW
MKDETFHFVFASDFAAMRDVQGQLVASLTAHGFDDEAMFAIKLALEEGLINAIKHGNRHDPKKHVTVDATITDKAAEFWIHDEGSGFKRNQVPDPTHESNLEKSSGRGLLLIESYMTEVEYSDDGRRLHMAFRKKK